LKFTFVHYLHRHASDNADRYRKQAEEARQQAEKKAISPNDNEARGSASPRNGSSSHCQRREGTGGKAASVKSRESKPQRWPRARLDAAVAGGFHQAWKNANQTPARVNTARQVLTVSRASNDGPVTAGCAIIAVSTIVPFLVTMTLSLTASEKLPLVGRSLPAAQGSIAPCQFDLAPRL